jgi:gamma-glutamyltranspeptidase/glutathione hydrolase
MTRIHAAVASGHSSVSEAAVEILRAGGNAFDAAVAAGCAAAVAEPGLTSLGGGGFLLARPVDGPPVLFDFFVDIPGLGQESDLPEPHFLPVTVRFPSSSQVFNVGLGSVAVPGNLAGLLHVQHRLGRLEPSAVTMPAVRLAREGVTVNRQQAYIFTLLKPILTLTEAGRRLFAPRGRLLRVGEQLVNPELALFLEDLPTSAESFYHGELAARIEADMQAGQGLLGRADLATYRVRERQPLVIDYRGYRLLTNPPPAFGGELIGLALQLLEAGELSGTMFGDRYHLQLLAAALLEVENQRAIRLKGDFDGTELALGRHRVRLSSGGTTHISVCDDAGNAASMTVSNGEGSGYLVPGSGIMLNNMLGEDDLHPEGFHSDPPGQRVASMMAPSLLLHDGELRLVLGSGGSKRIRSALLQVLSNTVDFGLPLDRAIAAPRMHWDGERLQLEPGFAESAMKSLEKRWPLNCWSVQDMYFGGVHAVTPDGVAAGDARRSGHAVVIDG